MALWYTVANPIYVHIINIYRLCNTVKPINVDV